jgi:hypothetical protein
MKSSNNAVLRDGILSLLSESAEQMRRNFATGAEDTWSREPVQVLYVLCSVI